MKIKAWKKDWESNAGNAGWVHKKTGNTVSTMFNPINDDWYVKYRGYSWADGFDTVQDANNYAVDFMRAHPNG